MGGNGEDNQIAPAAVTLLTARVQADHVLRGYGAGATRLMQTIAPSVPADRLDRRLAARLADDAGQLGDAMVGLQRRFPDEPYRQRLGAIAERLRRTRLRLAEDLEEWPGRVRFTADLEAELAELAEALVDDGLSRGVGGELQDFRWQGEAF